MPQKKNAALSHLPRLVFVNSPDFQPAPVLTPDLAVDHPVTAKVVPFEDILDSSWVSPQFRTLNGSQSSKQNYKSRRQASICARQRLNQIDSDICSKSCKFKPLQFVSGNSNEPGLQTKPVSELKVYPPEIGACYNTGHEIDDASQLSCLGIMNNIIVHTPAVIGQDNSSACLPDGKSSHNPLGISDSISRKTIETTPTRTSYQDKIQRRLLKPHNLFCQGRCSDSDVAQQSTNLKDCPHNMQAIEGLISSEMNMGPCPKAPDYEKNYLGASNSKNITSLASKSSSISNNSGSSPLTKMESAILVVDTPVYDYGLTFRQRQLRSMLTN